MAQAEHDPDAVALLVTTSRTLAKAVRDSVAEQLSALPPDESGAAVAWPRMALILLARNVAARGALRQSLCARST